jgi:uncharacterized protein with gpF-like domain
MIPFESEGGPTPDGGYLLVDTWPVPSESDATVAKAGNADGFLDEAQMTDLLDQIEPDLRSAFLDMIARVRLQIPQDAILTMLEEGNLNLARDTFERGAHLFSQSINDSFALSAQRAAEMLSTALKVIVNYDQFNERAILHLRENNLRLVRNFTQEQVDVARNAIENSIASGQNPIRTATEFRDAIGLTPYQQKIVQSYRDTLEGVHRARSMNTDALTRELRDGRSDRSVINSINSGRPLPQEQIDSMVDRYRANWIAFRAETIARTEGLRALHAGVDEMMAQVVDSGDVPNSQITRYWNTAGDERVRPAHVAMEGQERAPGEDFMDGDGNPLAYPGDPNAPPETTINCRCVVSTRISLSGGGGAQAADTSASADQGAVDEEALAAADAGSSDEG